MINILVINISWSDTPVLVGEIRCSSDKHFVPISSTGKVLPTVLIIHLIISISVIFSRVLCHLGEIQDHLFVLCLKKGKFHVDEREW